MHVFYCDQTICFYPPKPHLRSTTNEKVRPVLRIGDLGTDFPLEDSPSKAPPYFQQCRKGLETNLDYLCLPMCQARSVPDSHRSPRHIDQQNLAAFLKHVKNICTMNDTDQGLQ
ncbi:hypothetical protein BT93_B2906 [Corymbia citriodora subsp. variegata]|nr:hypothetical protein BT93_B2906 [Corymbia citriodora subsp. variegata]